MHAHQMLFLGLLFSVFLFHQTSRQLLLHTTNQPPAGEKTALCGNAQFQRFRLLIYKTQSILNVTLLLICLFSMKAQSMDGERERLNQRISELTNQLSTAKTTIQGLETINVS